jgi:hypothetical protein
MQRANAFRPKLEISLVAGRRAFEHLAPIRSGFRGKLEGGLPIKTSVHLYRG